MATIKNTSNVLGNLVNQINLGLTNVQSVMPSISIDDESIPSNMLDVAPVFEINYKSTLKQCYKKAKLQLLIIVKDVVPTILLNSLIIIDKIDLDAEQLGNLYYEYAKSDKVTLACMETIAHGETLARLFEVYIKMTDSLLKLSAKITETQNQMRKYYIDTYLDLQQKDEADETLMLPNSTHQALPKVSQDEKLINAGNVFVGTDNAIKMIAEKKRLAMQAKYEEIKDEKK